MLIGLCGRKNAGKDTVADYLVKNYGFKKLSFADPIRQVAKIVGYSDEQITKNKDEKNPVTHCSFRYFAQQFGTDFMRHRFSENIWISLLACKLNESLNTVVSDCRFNNEAQFIKSKGGIIVNIRGDMAKVDTHESEIGVGLQFIDYFVINKREKLVNTFRQVNALMETYKNG